LVLLGGSTVLAQTQPYGGGYAPPPGAAGAYGPPGYQEHDGFFLRLHCGGGYLTTSESLQGNSLTLAGPAFAFSAAFGGAVTPNLIVFGELLGMGVSDPKATLNGAYYVEPMNLYFSGTLTFSQLSFDDKNSSTKAESEIGFGFSAALGKEWWVSTDWGLGAAALFQFASMKDKGIDARITALGFALLFSATYN
jgi:hypothetical protein